MRWTLRRGWPLFAVAATVAAVFWLLYAVWRSPDRSDLSTYGAFAVAVVVAVAGCIAWAWQRARRSPVAGDAGAEHLDRVADVLAEGLPDPISVALAQTHNEHHGTGHNIAVSGGSLVFHAASAPPAGGEKDGNVADSIKKQCGALATELNQFLADRHREDPSVRISSLRLPPTASESQQDEARGRFTERALRHSQETMARYRERYHGRALTVFDSAVAIGLGDPRSRGRFRHPTNRLGIQEVADTLTAIAGGQHHD